MPHLITIICCILIIIQAARFPRDSFSSLKGLQGRTVETDAVSFFAAISTTDILDTPRKTIAFRRSDDSEWSVEELIAMQFAYVKELAEIAAGNSVHDVVVTVCTFFVSRQLIRN